MSPASNPEGRQREFPLGKRKLEACYLKLFFPIHFIKNNDTCDDYNDADHGKGCADGHKSIAVVLSGADMHDIISGLAESPAHEFCDAQVQVIVIHIKIAPEYGLGLIIHNGVCRGTIVQIKCAIHIF